MRENDGSAFALVDVGHPVALNLRELLLGERPAGVGHVLSSSVRAVRFTTAIVMALRGHNSGTKTASGNFCPLLRTSCSGYAPFPAPAPSCLIRSVGPTIA